MPGKQTFYAVVLGLLCAGATAKIGTAYWHNAHAAEEAEEAALERAEQQPDWVAQFLSADAPAAHMSDQHPCVYESMEQDTAGPRLGQCGMPTSLFTDPVDQFEVDLRYGTFVVRQTDLSLSDGVTVPFTRAYVSDDSFYPNHVHAFGKNSNQTYDIAPLGTRNPYTWLAIALEDGDFLYFDRISSGTSFSDALYRHTETNGRFYKAILFWNGDGWTAKLPDGSLIVFPESYNSSKISDGAPTEVVDAMGNKVRLVRDADRNLQEIRTPHGHVIRLMYNDQGSISRAEDDRGDWATYLYNIDGMLMTATFSSGKKRQYEYDGAQMTVIRDENGNVLVRNTYVQGHVVVQQFANGAVYKYSYRGPPSGAYAETAIVQLPDGTQQTFDTAASVPDYVKQPQQ
jgi:YD repeat-containing protein